MDEKTIIIHDCIEAIKKKRVKDKEKDKKWKELYNHRYHETVYEANVSHLNFALGYLEKAGFDCVPFEVCKECLKYEK